MAFLDFLLTKAHKEAKVATRIGVESGLFVMCPVCHAVTEAKNPERHQEKTSELVRGLITKGGTEAELFNRKAEELQKTIEAVARKLPYHCICQSI